MSENPTNATRSPSRSITRGRRAPALSKPAPTPISPASPHMPDGVGQRRRAVVADVVVGEVDDVQAGEAAQRRAASRAAAEGVLLGDGRAAVGDRALEVAERDVGGPQQRRDLDPRPARPARRHDRHPGHRPG